MIQEAQLSQRDRAMFYVTEYFAESDKVTQGHWNWYQSKASYGFPIRNPYPDSTQTFGQRPIYYIWLK